MRLVGANASAVVSGADELPGKTNYFIGNDPRKWRTNVATYAKVKYHDVYPGVDLVYYGNQGGQLEYDFVVAPGADPSVIKLDVGAGLALPANVRSNVLSSEKSARVAESTKRAGQAQPLQISADGDLVVKTDGGEVRFHKPVVYQPMTNSGPRTSDLGLRTAVEGHYVLQANNQIGFEVASYDHTRPLVIDPVLSYSTFLGGSNSDQGYSIAVDSSGNAYVTGNTLSADFPTMNPLQANNNDYSDAFVTKLNAAGTALVYSTFLGGSYYTYGQGIAVDSSGNAYVAGATSSTDFPTVNPIQATNHSTQNAFVAELNAAGSALVYSTYLGGSNNVDYAYGIAVDSSGNAYVTGKAGSTDFPIANPIQATNHGGYDAFVAKLNAAGSALVYSTYLGGSGNDIGFGIAVDSSGNAYVTGSTGSNHFPTVNPLQASCGGCNPLDGDAFVAKLNPAGSALVYSTFLGGSGIDAGYGIVVDSSGNAYVTGYTESNDFPTANPLQANKHGAANAFVAKLNVAGSALVYSTYLGGSYSDQGLGIAVDSPGDAYVTGVTQSTDFPTVNPLQATNNASEGTAFVAMLNADGSALGYSTYLGGSHYEVGSAITVDSTGNAYVTGATQSNNFPTINPFQASLKGSQNVFVAKVSTGGAGPSASFSQLSLTFGPQAVDTTSGSQTETVTNNGMGGLNISTVAVGGTNASDFATSADTCTGATLAPTSTCMVSVTFTPLAAGNRNASLNFTDNAANGPQVVSLTGRGSNPALLITASSGSMTYGGAVPTITPSYAGFVNGDTAASLTTQPTCSTTATSSSPVGSYPSTCSGAVDANYSISYMAGTVTITSVPLTITAPSPTINAGSAIPSFTPTYNGFVNGQTAGSLTTQPVCTTTATNSSPAGTYPITCSGAVDSNYNISYVAGTLTITATGLQGTISLSPTSLSFGNQPLNTTSGVRPVTVTNTGTAPLIVSSVATSAEYADTSTCTSPVNPGGTCTLNITFTPTALGTQMGTVTVNSNASNGPQVVNLTGNGFAGAALSCTNCGVGRIAVGSGGGEKIITLANAQNVALTNISISITGSNDYSQTNTCGTALGARQTCAITVMFTPSIAGVDNATLTVADSAANSPQTATLMGGGVD